MKEEFSLFNNLIVRTPTHPLRAIGEIPSSDVEIDLYVRSLYEFSEFKEAIYIASPSLLTEWSKAYIGGRSLNDRLKINSTIIKYLLRSTTRCTPFGLFSSYSTFKIDGGNDCNNYDYKLFTTLDSHFLCNLTTALNNNKILRSLLKYKPNSTLYKIGEEYRYYEVSFNNNKRSHVLVSMPWSDPLQLIKDFSGSGKTIDQLVIKLIERIDDITNQEAHDFINELINEQYLTSSLDLNLNSESPLQDIVNTLDIYKEAVNDDVSLNKIYYGLKEIVTELDHIDNKITESRLDRYKIILNIISTFNIPFNEKYLINVVCKNQYFKGNTLKEHHINKIINGIKILKGFSPKFPENQIDDNINLKKFKQAFIKRYEEKEIPLLIALDNEAGIGYLQRFNSYNSFSSLIDEFDWSSRKNNTEAETIIDSPSSTFWSKCFLEALENKSYTIDLSEKDLSEFDLDETPDLPSTFSVMASLRSDKIVIESAGATSALNLFARYGVKDKELQDLTNEITNFEKTSLGDVILAEVIHIPHNRAGNILMRNVKRDAEITILVAQSNTEIINLSLEDILISVKNNEVILLSRKLKKRIIPYVSSVHNFHNDTLPVYHLLCDLQSQSKLNNLSLGVGALVHKHFNFFPRIIYGNELILSPAIWKLKIDDLSFLINQQDQFLVQKFDKFRIERHIPRYVNIVEGFDELTIDTQNLYLLKYLIEQLNKNKLLQISEILYDNSDFLSDSPSRLANQYLLSFSNNCLKPLNNQISFTKSSEEIERTFFPTTKWVYIKMYAGTSSIERIISQKLLTIIQLLFNESLIEEWFFIRYEDPDFHLRLRFKCVNEGLNTQRILEIVNNEVRLFTNSNLIWKIDISTYQRELERYHAICMEDAEAIFYYDSEFVAGLLSKIKSNHDYDKLWLLALKSINDYLLIFLPDITERYLMMDDLYKAFSGEFKLDSKFKVQVDLKFRQNRHKIFSTLEENSYLDQYYNLFNNRARELEAIYKKLLTKTTTKERFDLLKSYIHMNINRVFKSNHRMHEVILYGLLEKYYKSNLARARLD